VEADNPNRAATHAASGLRREEYSEEARDADIGVPPEWLTRRPCSDLCEHTQIRKINLTPRGDFLRRRVATTSIPLLALQEPDNSFYEPHLLSRSGT
jgi:hypothetical protein